MPIPLYSGYRGGVDVGLLEMCTDWITISLLASQDDSGGIVYANPIAYGAITAGALTNPFILKPSTDPFFAQATDDPTAPALFRCQFVVHQKEVLGGEGNGLLLAGNYILPAAPWFNYASFMNQYNWFQRKDNVDVQNPKGYEKIKVTSISARHDLNRQLSHYEIEVAR